MNEKQHRVSHSISRARAASFSLGVLAFASLSCGGANGPSFDTSASAGGASVTGNGGNSAAAGASAASGGTSTASGGTQGAGSAAPGSGGTAVSGNGGSLGTGSAVGAGGSMGAGGGSAATGGASTNTGGSGGAQATGDKFSFFVTSFAALQRLSGNQQGFGGDLRFGETGPGAGLRGADKICATIAETSMKGAGTKGWHAFLSAADDGTGKQVNAIERIGTGPWYDRLGRLFGNSVTDINATRPTMADAAIQNDFPNEDGVPNHAPDPTAGQVDNHDMLTGSDTTGKLFDATATCLDWTSAMGDTAKEGKPRCGHSWPRAGMGGPGGIGGRGGMGGPGGDMNNWMSALTESGCKAGANLIEQGGPQQNQVTVGSGGGYGGFYCFATTP